MTRHQAATDPPVLHLGAMAAYRLYQLDDKDHILGGYSLECLSDRAAMSAACRLAERALPVEVWQHTRCVGRVRAPTPWPRMRRSWLSATRLLPGKMANDARRTDQ